MRNTYKMEKEKKNMEVHFNKIGSKPPFQSHDFFQTLKQIDVHISLKTVFHFLCGMTVQTSLAL